LPHFFAGSFGAGQQFVCPRRIITKHADVHVG
jgi:hypothetical protein